MVVLRQEGRHARLGAEHGCVGVEVGVGIAGGKLDVHAERKERVLLPPPDECLARRPRVVPGERGQVQPRWEKAQRVGPLGGRHGVGFGDRVAPVREVGRERGAGGEVD